MEGDSSVENIKNEDPTDQASKEETETDNKSEIKTSDQNIEKQPVHETNSSMADTSIEREVPKQENKSEMIERKGKVDVLLKAAGDAPIMKKKKWAVESNKSVAYLTQFIRKYIKCEPDESLFLYVNQTFVPSPDQVLSNLFDCFGTDGKLVLHYCKTQAWG